MDFTSTSLTSSAELLRERRPCDGVAARPSVTEREIGTAAVERTANSVLGASDSGFSVPLPGPFSRFSGMLATGSLLLSGGVLALSFRIPFPVSFDFLSFARFLSLGNIASSSDFFLDFFLEEPDSKSAA